MKRTEWQKLKVDNTEETGFEADNNKFSGLNFIYQFVGANNSKLACGATPFKNGAHQLGTKKKNEQHLTSGYRFTLTNLASMYEEVLSDCEAMAICKRLNPNVEVPEVVDLIQQIDEMLQCDKTEKTVTIDDNGTLSVMKLDSQETCKVIMNGELAGCDFKWEFKPTKTDPFTFYSTITEPAVGCLTLLLRNQSRLVQLLEAKDQEILDYTLNGAVLSRKSLQTTFFDPKKEALTTPSNFTKADMLDGLQSPEYSEALKIFRASDQTTDVFIAPVAPKMAKTDLDNLPVDSLTGCVIRKRSHIQVSSTASVMKGPKPMQASQKISNSTSEEKSLDFSDKMLEHDSSFQQSPQASCSSSQVKKTRASKRSANASKNLLKKL